MWKIHVRHLLGMWQNLQKLIWKDQRYWLRWVERSGKKMEERIVEIISPPAPGLTCSWWPVQGISPCQILRQCIRRLDNITYMLLLHFNIHFIDNPWTVQHHQGGGRVWPAGWGQGERGWSPDLVLSGLLWCIINLQCPLSLPRAKAWCRPSTAECLGRTAPTARPVVGWEGIK